MLAVTPAFSRLQQKTASANTNTPTYVRSRMTPIFPSE
jgi:hypothetical protein